jgi:hypothetical protein
MAYERVLREKKFRAIAMSVFASGAIAPKEAIEWICQQSNIESILLGASSRANIHNTRELVDQYWPIKAKEDLSTLSAVSPIG